MRIRIAKNADAINSDACIEPSEIADMLNKDYAVGLMKEAMDIASYVFEHSSKFTEIVLDTTTDEERDLIKLASTAIKN